MRTVWRRWWWIPVIALLSFPASFVVTLLLWPLWSWVEATFGVESMGHSGPADWCFWAVCGLLTLLGWALAGFASRRSRVRRPSDPGAGA